MPKLTFDKLDVIPEGLRETATQVDGKFVIDVVPQAKLVEFRDNNIALKQQVEGLTGKVTAFTSLIGTDDVEKFKTEFADLRTTKQQVIDGKLKTTDAIETALTQRTNEMKTGYESQLREAGQKLQQTAAERDELRGKLNRSIVDREVTNAVLAKDSGVNPAALPDILHRAYGLFSVTPEGKLVPKQGDTVVYGTDGATPMTPKEWLTKVLVEAPYLGLQSAGGGANGSGDKKVAGLSGEAFQALPPAERLKRARAAQ